MKKQSTVGYVLRLALTLLAITSVVGLALAGVNAITKDKIAALKLEKTQKAITQVLPGGYDREVTEFADQSGLVQKVYAGDNTITMMVGVSAEGKVLGISVVSHTETKGLGEVAAAQNTKGEAFRDQFVGADSQLAVSKDGGTIDAITGATITSRAVTKGVNAALACVKGLTN